jgi:hypothetical protein
MLHLVGNLFPHINDDARSKSLQTYYHSLVIVPIIHTLSILPTHILSDYKNAQ